MQVSPSSSYVCWWCGKTINNYHKIPITLRCRRCSSLNMLFEEINGLAIGVPYSSERYNMLKVITQPEIYGDIQLYMKMIK